MKRYLTPEWDIRRISLSVLTASGDKDDWETDIVPDDEEDIDPEDQ